MLPVWTDGLKSMWPVVAVSLGKPSSVTWISPLQKYEIRAAPECLAHPHGPWVTRPRAHTGGNSQRRGTHVALVGNYVGRFVGRFMVLTLRVPRCPDSPFHYRKCLANVVKSDAGGESAMGQTTKDTERTKLVNCEWARMAARCSHDRSAVLPDLVRSLVKDLPEPVGASRYLSSDGAPMTSRYCGSQPIPSSQSQVRGVLFAP